MGYPPVLGWVIPQPGQDGGGGTPGQVTPSSWDGVPPQPGQDGGRGTPPNPGIGYPSPSQIRTGGKGVPYAASGMSLAFTQEGFLGFFSCIVFSHLQNVNRCQGKMPKDISTSSGAFTRSVFRTILSEAPLIFLT